MNLFYMHAANFTIIMWFYFQLTFYLIFVIDYVFPFYVNRFETKWEALYKNKLLLLLYRHAVLQWLARDTETETRQLHCFLYPVLWNACSEPQDFLSVFYIWFIMILTVTISMNINIYSRNCGFIIPTIHRAIGYRQPFSQLISH